MAYCYTPIDSPAFFYNAGECGDVNHDFTVKDGDLDTTTQTEVNNIISAVLIQLHTDKVFNAERGFWGDEFISFAIGNHTWTIEQTNSTSGRTVRAESMLIEALEPLIQQGMIDEIKISVSQVVGGIEAEIDIIKDGQSIFKTVA